MEEHKRLATSASEWHRSAEAVLKDEQRRLSTGGRPNQKARRSFCTESSSFNRTSSNLLIDDRVGLGWMGGVAIGWSYDGFRDCWTGLRMIFLQDVEHRLLMVSLKDITRLQDPSFAVCE